MSDMRRLMNIVTEAVVREGAGSETLYHVTLQENVPIIMEQGLMPQDGQPVFLSTDISDAVRRYADPNHKGYGPHVVLAVRLADLDPTHLGPDLDDLWELYAEEDWPHEDREPDDMTWQESLQMCSQCSYNSIIPPAAIRVARTV